MIRLGRQSRENWHIIFTLAPALLFILVLFGGGIFFGLMQSIGYFTHTGTDAFTLEYYHKTLNDTGFWLALWLTFQIAFLVSLISIICAILFALILRHDFWGSGIIKFIFQIPLPVPHLVAAGATILLFAQSGFISRIFVEMGVISSPRQFPALLYDEFAIGISISFLWKEIPFVGLVVLAIMKSIGPQYEEIAATMGANKWQRFRYILLPLIMPGVISTSIIIFAFTFANFEIPLLLGQTHPTTLPVLAYKEFISTDLDRRPLAMAMSLILAMICILLMIAYKKLARYASYGGK